MSDSLPRVSVLLPTLDGVRYLKERLASIQSQSLRDWELVVSDNFSEDGTWEIIRVAAASDPRICAEQAPREGMYQNWNRCLSRARGEMIYVATHDDTMSPDCLLRLVAALDEHPECEIAQCCLHGIDSNGRIIPDWWRLAGAARFLGDAYLRPHLRRAPYDGVLHCAMHTIYHASTQILIRRRAFAKVGPFPENFGPGGDFLWGMKLGLNCDVVHVPEFLATWRMHPDQASHDYRETSAERALMAAMVDAALAARLPGSVAARLPAAPLRFPYRYDFFRLAYAQAPDFAARLSVVLRLLAQPSVAWRAARLVFEGQRRDFDKVRYTRTLLRLFHLEKNFVPLPGVATPAPP